MVFLETWVAPACYPGSWDAQLCGIFCREKQFLVYPTLDLYWIDIKIHGMEILLQIGCQMKEIDS